MRAAPSLSLPRLPSGACRELPTSEQIEELRGQLTSGLAAAVALLDQTAEDSRPVDLALPSGRLTHIDAIQMQAMAQLNRRQLEIRRQQIELALATFDQRR
ncbi:MAG TPA: hypothetical protein VLA75_03520 [Thermoanaerobaculia bacterium]|nr:hypothetical protein [Thermoanaerobaculia bacterium]